MIGPSADLGTVERLAAAQAHRGPDGDWSWSSKNDAFAHRRLRIIDLSEAAGERLGITVEGVAPVRVEVIAQPPVRRERD